MQGSFPLWALLELLTLQLSSECGENTKFLGEYSNVCQQEALDVISYKCRNGITLVIDAASCKKCCAVAAPRHLLLQGENGAQVTHFLSSKLISLCVNFPLALLLLPRTAPAACDPYPPSRDNETVLLIQLGQIRVSDLCTSTAVCCHRWKFLTRLPIPWLPK